MGCPAGMTNAIRSVQRLQADHFFQVVQLAFGAAYLQTISVTGHGNPGRIVAAIFQPSETVEDDRNNALLPDVTNNPTHTENPKNYLIRQGETKLFNHWIRQHFASHPLHFGLGLLAV